MVCVLSVARRRITTACLVWFSILWAWAPALRAQSAPVSLAYVQLDYFLSHPSDDDLEYALAAAQESANDPRAQQRLRTGFQERWISDDKHTGLTLRQFRQLAERCRPFGKDDSLLFSFLADGRAPTGWKEREFRDYIAERLSSSPRSQAARLLAAGFPQSASEALDRYAFLVEVLPQDAVVRLRSSFDTQRLAKSRPEEMAELAKILRKMRENQVGLVRFETGDEAAHILRVTGDHLLELPPDSWPAAGPEIQELVKNASKPPTEFLQRAADYLRQHA
ncbi:MAG TPA: hypothetical protein VI386_27130, partial [Candidatus Sulfotelmatobacter sp.]